MIMFERTPLAKIKQTIDWLSGLTQLLWLNAALLLSDAPHKVLRRVVCEKEAVFQSLFNLPYPEKYLTTL